MKKCSACGQTVSITKFYKDSSKKDGLASSCKSCSAERLRKWRRGEGKSRSSNPYPRRFRKEYLDSLRSSPCTDCQISFPTVCMDFDHLPGSEKRFTIMSEYYWRPWPDVLEEVAKCEVVCANCHRIRTLSRRVL